MNVTRREAIVGRAFATAAALCYGTSSVLVKKGLGVLAPPLVGAAIAMLSATMVLSIMETINPESNLRQKKKSAGFLALTGVFSGLGIAFSFLALNQAPVVIVNPFNNISPLFALLFAHLFLGRLEKITMRIILGTTLIAGGAILITMGGS